MQKRIERNAVQHAWSRRGFSCELWVDPPGQVWNDFVHDVDEIVLLVDGYLACEFDGRTVRLGPGDELLIPAGVRHTTRNLGEGMARWLHGYRRVRDQPSQL